MTLYVNCFLGIMKTTEVLFSVVFLIEKGQILLIFFHIFVIRNKIVLATKY